MTSKKQTTETTQQSQTQPWKPTIPVLEGILSGINQNMNFNPTDTENQAISTLRSNAAGMGNFTPQATAYANDLMGGGTDRTGYLTGGFNDYKSSLQPYLSQDYLDPTNSPGIQSLLDTVRGDVSNSINAQFAGAGRDLSGINQQSLARGVTQATAPILLDQYNKNIATQRGAQDALFGAGGATAGALSGLDQQTLANRGLGLDVAINGIPQAQNAQANAMLEAEARARGIPIQNLAALEALTVPIAGLGGQSNMQGTTTSQSKSNPWQVGIGAGLGLLGLATGNPFLATGGFGSSAGGLFGGR